MAGSGNFARVGMSGLNELPPPIAAEASSGISQRFTLDRSAFEKLLAAAWVLQCLHDQLHNPERGLDQPHTETFRTHEPAGVENSVLQAAVNPAAQFPPRVTNAGSADGVPSGPSAADETFAKPIEIQQAIETGTVNFNAAVEAERELVELKKSLHSEDVAMVHATEPPVPALENPAHDLADDNGNDKERVHRPAFNLWNANLRNASNRMLDAVSNLGPVLRVNLTPRALRAAAIATPVVLLAIVAASLLFETWHHEPFHSAQATSTPGLPATNATVSKGPTMPATSTAGTSRHTKPIGSTQPKRTRRIPPLEVSHKRVTERTTLSVVQGLSPYEIGGLRRQAKYGDASASFTLGMAYEMGHNVPQNCAEAARWVAKAAEAGNAAAQYNLGLRYRDGDGVPANRAESEKWLRRAAAHRNRQAERALKTLATR